MLHEQPVGKFPEGGWNDGGWDWVEIKWKCLVCSQEPFLQGTGLQSGHFTIVPSNSTQWVVFLGTSLKVKAFESLGIRLTGADAVMSPQDRGSKC